MPKTTPFEQLKTSIARAVRGRAQSSVVRASRAAVATLAYDATSWVHGVTEVTQRAFNKRSTGRIWLPSFVGLGATDVAFSSARIATAAKGLAVVGATGGVGLIAASTVDLWHAKTPEEL